MVWAIPIPSRPLLLADKVHRAGRYLWNHPVGVVLPASFSTGPICRPLRAGDRLSDGTPASIAVRSLHHPSHAQNVSSHAANQSLQLIKLSQLWRLGKVAAFQFRTLSFDPRNNHAQ